MYFRKLFDFYKHNGFAFCLGSAWFVIINSGLFCGVQYYKHFDNRHPYISDAIEIFKLRENVSIHDELKVISKNGNIDSSNKRAKCELVLLYNGEKVHLDINAIYVKKVKKKKSKDDGEDAEIEEHEDEENEEDEEEDSKDISVYIENPYLIKEKIRKYFWKNNFFFLSFKSEDRRNNENLKDKEISDPSAVSEKKKDDKKLDKAKHLEEKILQIIEKQNKWKINNILLAKRKRQNSNDSLIVAPDNNSFLLNFLSKRMSHWYEIKAIYGNPKDNSYFYKYDEKKVLKKKQVNIMKVLFVTFLGSLALGCRRILTYKNGYSSLNYVKQFVYNNQHLHKLLDNNRIQILSISGQHEKYYVNSKVFLQAENRQAVVHITATKNKNDKDFYLLHAKLLVDNKVVELKEMEKK